jgi:hypothetical protein
MRPLRHAPLLLRPGTWLFLWTAEPVPRIRYTLRCSSHRFREQVVRATLHVLCVVAMLPYLLLAAAFLTLGYAIGQGSLPGFLDTLLSVFVLVFSWLGVAIIAAFLVLIGLGVSSRTRWVAAALACLAGTAALLVLVTMSRSAIGLPELLWLTPDVIASGCAGWLAAKEWPFRTRVHAVVAVESGGRV